MEKFHYFLYGKEFTLETDQKPLVSIYVMHQMQNTHGGSHVFHFSVTSTTMYTGTNRKAQQSCGSSTVRE